MNTTIASTPSGLTRLQSGVKLERVEGVHLQEQVAGPSLECNERSVADILTERLAESGVVSHAAPVFVP